MKSIIIIALSLFCIISFVKAQTMESVPIDFLSNVDKCGDDSLSLNSYEIAFLNNLFGDSINAFDFTNKKVGFIRAAQKKNKNDYFTMHKKHFADETSPADNGSLYIFDELQKEQSGGYDAAILYWSKFYKTKEEIIRILKR